MTAAVVLSVFICMPKMRANGNQRKFFWEEISMRYITGTREFNIEEPTVVTLGKFDGLHRGHQKLLNEVFRFRDKGYKTAVFTFETAPGL